jgi:hypothetical protein
MDHHSLSPERASTLYDRLAGDALSEDAVKQLLKYKLVDGGDKAHRFRCQNQAAAQILSDYALRVIPCETLSINIEPVLTDERSAAHCFDVIVEPIYYDNEAGWLGCDIPASPTVDFTDVDSVQRQAATAEDSFTSA